jgi:hypothetical protein
MSLSKPILLIINEEVSMRKYVAISIALIFVFTCALIAIAGHDPIVIPYEKEAMGHRTTMPLPAGGDLRHHITGHEPYKKWKIWPGKGELYKGTEPHGSLLTTYVNDIALDSIKNKKGMSNNSIIVKENYAPNKELVAVTVMYKVKGYNPDDGDWFWAKYSAAFEIIAEGKVKGCLACHGTVKGNDFVFTGDVTGK